MSIKDFFSGLFDFFGDASQAGYGDLNKELRHLRMYLNQREEAFNKLQVRVEELEGKVRELTFYK